MNVRIDIRLVLMFAICLAVSSTSGQEPADSPRDADKSSDVLSPDLRAAADALQNSVVTVRVQLRPNKNPGQITVCSGVCIHDGLIVTPAYAASDSLIRLTLPGGRQGRGRLRVIDEYCGLSLIAVEDEELSPLMLAPETPQVGSWVLAGAGWGVEQPMVSLGATLTIACEGPAALLLQHETTEVIDRINTFLGFAAVGRIKILQKPLTGHERKKTERVRQLSREETSRISSIVGEIEDDELRAALEQLGRSVMVAKGSSFT